MSWPVLSPLEWRAPSNLVYLVCLCILFGFYDFAGCLVAIVAAVELPSWRAADVAAAISHFMFMFRVNVAFHFPVHFSIQTHSVCIPYPIPDPPSLSCSPGSCVYPELKS